MTSGTSTRVIVDWAPELKGRLRTGLPLTVLAQATLQPPLGRLLIMGRSDDGGVSLAASLMPGGRAGVLALSAVGIIKPAGAGIPPAALRPRFPAREHRKGIFILDAEGDDLFLVGSGLLNQVVVSCGPWPLLIPLVGPRAPKLQPEDEETLASNLDTFCAVVAASIDGVYRHLRQEGPELKVTLRPEGPTVNDALEGVRRLGRSAAGAASTGLSGLRREPPGQVHRPHDEAIPEVSFADVGGQDEARSELEAICAALRDPTHYRRWAVRPPRGVLLYGPPGTGKTLLARCLAGEAGARFIHVRATDITSKWYGEAESRLQQAFDWARQQSPAVIFFDEIDAIARNREDSHEATHRLVSTLLENMDGLREMQGVLVLAATNRPEAVDSALTRPGRFDRLVEVPLPPRAGRKAIFAVHLRRAEQTARRRLFVPLGDRDWERLLSATEGFSGAEIAETVRRALETRARAGDLEGEIAADDLVEHARTVARPW